jgi:hypothetical protein
LAEEWARKEGHGVCENEIIQVSFFQAVTDAPELSAFWANNIAENMIVRQ